MFNRCFPFGSISHLDLIPTNGGERSYHSVCITACRTVWYKLDLILHNPGSLRFIVSTLHPILHKLLISFPDDWYEPFSRQRFWLHFNVRAANAVKFNRGKSIWNIKALNSCLIQISLFSDMFGNSSLAYMGLTPMSPKRCLWLINTVWNRLEEQTRTWWIAIVSGAIWLCGDRDTLI